MQAKPTRDLLIDWVLAAWEAVPLELVQRGMQDLIVQHALGTDADVPAVPRAAPFIGPVLPDELVGQAAALAVLDTLDDPEIERESLSDEEEEEDSPASDPDPEPPAVLPSRVDLNPPMPDFCLRCERPLRTNNAIQCVNMACKAWFHVGCISTSSSGKCMVCP